MKRFRVIAVAIVLLIAGSLIISSLQSPPVNVARDYCARKGFPAQDLEVQGYQYTAGLSANRCTVQFGLKGANPVKQLFVDLHQSVYFLPWQPVALREES
ncbi:MAG TPA: hypothetical protein VGF55_06600 [Gemmataceae bacterium]